MEVPVEYYTTENIWAAQIGLVWFKKNSRIQYWMNMEGKWMGGRGEEGVNDMTRYNAWNFLKLIKTYF